MIEHLLFHVRNKQVAASDEPLGINGNTPNRYHTYFENAQGEQLVFVYDREADIGTLYHSDMGWDQPRPV